MSDILSEALSLDIEQIASSVMRKFNPNHGPDGRFTSGPGGNTLMSPDRGGGRGGGGGGGSVPNDKPAASQGDRGGTWTTRAGETLYPVKYSKSKKKWMLSNGKPAPEHIQSLGITPGSKNVRVNLDKSGDLVAHWTADNGKIQPRYSDNHNMRSCADRFGRTSELRKVRASIQKEMMKDMKSKDRETRESAAAALLISKTGMRPGGTDTGAQYKSYGATTLEGRHVKVDKSGNVYLDYVPGKKKGKNIKTPIHDKDLAGELLRRAKKSGPNGRVFDTDHNKVREYNKKKDGGGFKTKDHRTAVATETAIEIIRGMQRPKTKEAYKKMVGQVSQKVADVIGNTKAVAFKSYIDPQVWVPWSVE